MQTPKKYKVRSGTIDSGKPYEIKVVALLSLKCCLKDLEHFWMASNVNECGALDDVILFTKEKNKQGITYLTQLKHQDAAKTITKDQILAAEGNFSLKKYLDSCVKLSNEISNQNTKKSDIIDHLRNNPEMVYVLYTNKNVAGQFEFLEPINSCSDFLNVNGNVYGFKPDGLNIFTTPNNPKEAFLKRIFLYTKQPHIKEIDNEIKTTLKRLIGSVKKSDKDLGEIVRKFEFFIEEWSKGSLNGYYPLTKTLVLKKITEILLEPFMVRFEGQNPIQERKEDAEECNLWNEMIGNKNLIVVNQSDKVTNEFVDRFVYNFTVKHERSVKNCTTIRKDLLRVTGSAQITTFCEVYEHLWKTWGMPLVIQVDSESEIEEVTEVLKMSQETFRIIILNKSKIAIDHLKSSEMFYTVTDLQDEHQKKLFSLPIELQGRHLNGIAKLNCNLKEIFDLRVKDIIYILCHRFNIGGDFEALPDVFVDISLKRVWLKQVVLQEAIDDVFVIHCKFMEELKQFIQGDSLDVDDTEMIEWKNINSFDCDCHRIVLYENEIDLEDIERYLKKHMRKPIHFLISHKNSKLEWINSWGPIKILKQFRISEAFEEKRVMASDAIVNFCTEMKSIIISSNPGMGKSVFIHYFARNAPVDFWVVKINLAKYKVIYKNFINESECDINLNYFFEQILEEGCKENLFLAKAVFGDFFKSKNIVVLLDGFDEIPIKYQNDAKHFIKFLSKSGYFVLVTTRPVLKNDLESLLDTFSLNLNLFIREDQEYFLKNYFSKFAEVVCEKETTILYVNFLLNAAKNNLNDHDNEFTGVPLQTLLLAEVFIDDFKTFLVSRKFINKHFDLLYLYKNFIEKKIRIACEKFGDISEDMIYEYKICRTFYALRLLFSEEDLKELEIDVKLENGKTLFPHMLELVQKDGIVVAETETNIVFIHQTFAEYLAAEWLAENVKKEHKDIAKNLLKVTFDPNLKVVRNIFDRILAKNCPLHLAIINFQIDKVANLINSNHFEDLDDGDRNFLHILASWGLHHTMKCIQSELFQLKKMLHEDEMLEILNLIPDEKLNNSKDQILEYTPIDYAIISSSLCIADKLCDKMKTSRIYIDLEADDKNLVLLYCYKMNYFSLIRKIINHTSMNSELFVNNEDRDSLSFIISKGNIKKLNLLVSEGMNLNDKDKFGSAPIHIAVRLEKEEMVKILISNSVNINVTDSTGKTPLHWSALQGLLSIVKLLVANGTDVNIVDNQGRTAFHYAVISHPQHQIQIISELSNTNLEILDENDMTPFLWAAHYGDTECVNFLLELGVAVEQKNTNELTALLWAAGNGHIDTVNLMLSRGANIHAKSTNGTTPLLFAARYGYTNVVNFLLDNGAEIESRDHDGMSALCWAAQGGHYEIASLLINRQAKITTETGVDASSIASRHGHKDVLELLLSHGANIESEDDEKRTPLHWAASNGHKDIVKLYLTKGANVNAQDKYGNNALYRAIIHGFMQVVKLLLSKGSEIPKNCLHLAAERGHSDLISVFLHRGMDINLEDENGMTALHYAARFGCKKSVALLLIKGADIEARNNENQTPLILAVKEGCVEVTNLLLTEGANIEARTNKNETSLIVSARYNRNMKTTSLLLSEGARIKSKDVEGRLAFHWAVYNSYTVQETVELFLSKSFEMIEAKTSKQETPLILAAQNGSIKIIRFLLSKNVDLEAKDCNGMNSLHWAAAKGRTKVVHLLLSRKADVEAKDNDNKTALIFAAENGHKDVISLLLLAGARVRARDKNGLTALNWAKNCNQADAVTLLKSANRFTIDRSGYFLICVTFIVLILSWLLLKFM